MLPYKVEVIGDGVTWCLNEECLMPLRIDKLKRILEK